MVWAQGTIQSQATDLPDTTPGQDLWRYAYNVSGFNFQMNEGFSVFFDAQLYRNLANPAPSLSPIWSVIAVQPDVLLQAAGYLDALALTSSPSLATTFQVDFVWLGQGTPGAQPFYIYDPTFAPISSGNTSIPEPGAWLILSLGILLWLGRRTVGFRKTLSQ